MNQCKLGPFLESARLRLRPLISELAATGGYDYLSVLGTDDKGLAFSATPGETRCSEPMWTQRGFCIRAQHKGRIVEYSTSVLPEDPATALKLLQTELDTLFAGDEGIQYATLQDIPAKVSWFGSCEEDPFQANPGTILSRMEQLRSGLASRQDIVMAQCKYDTVQVQRIFITPNRDLAQSWIWSQAYLVGVARKGEVSRYLYMPASGRAGLELLNKLEAQATNSKGQSVSKVENLAVELSELLDSTSIEPGEYTVILSPDMAGTLAHEAFGHGVETDMFQKGRAKAVEYIGKRVGSELVTMFDGATGVDQNGSFLFDDEGSMGTKTTIIDKGILLGGISDTLSASALGLKATGNGRRQAFDHKAYARMTNTYFASGNTALADMIAATPHGWYLDHLSAGMEDPRNWGVQLVCLVGREIRNGVFTGRVASPVVCSGYVPEVLGAIDMISPDFELSGSGACGKGHKEYVKVSSGGPFVRTRMRLG